MIKDSQIYIGNKFIGEINYERFEIVDIRDDKGVTYVIVEDKNKKRIYVTMERFKSLLLIEDYNKRSK